MTKLRELREKKGVSQRDVAKFMNLTQAAYWSLEKGRSLLNSQQIINLSIYFECTPNDLLDFKSHYQIIMSEVFDKKK
ncbi:helix-turn-helix domain-containing protein [Paracholeplasma manati]|uniref:helix-turn-helix domain-containing protein n=1 Tax=Paracholeplasma manati TaxID=591373 RepID=UPI00240815E9|nr:helix-turn-helix transcriptional regulator [Paracholeplasma manati]MDG0888788.1 helix-turn-helix transcriptional regulator [Paracholeplasma manati]